VAKGQERISFEGSEEIAHLAVWGKAFLGIARNINLIGFLL